MATGDFASLAGELLLALPGIGDPRFEQAVIAMVLHQPDGAMGVHAANQGLIRAGVLDPLRPNVLLYMPRKDGSLDLIGVEYMRVDADQNLETDGDRPSLFGHAFQGPMLGHNPTMPIHYDLHVWVVDNNPSGTFAQFNPDFHC